MLWGSEVTYSNNLLYSMTRRFSYGYHEWRIVGIDEVPLSILITSFIFLSIYIITGTI